MGVETGISWTDHTFNPWWGCTRVSPGCEHCYAETFAKRTGHQVWGKRSERRFFGDKHWAEPLRWDRAADAAGRPALVFCASMADVFEDRDDLVEPLGRLWDLITATPHLIWQILTKRPHLVQARTPRLWWQRDDDGRSLWPENVWIGTTVENGRSADERLPELVRIPAPVRFLSCEPLLGAVDLSRWLGLEWMDSLRAPGEPLSFRGEGGWGREMIHALGRRHPLVEWIIVGGESGPRHRPLNLDHARDLRDQADAAGVPFFFKQVGGLRPTSGGDQLDGRTHKAFPPAALRGLTSEGR